MVKNVKNKKVRTLIYDIETSYTVGAVWGLYEQNVAHVLKEPYIISVAWRWLGENKTNVKSLKDYSKTEIVLTLWELFNEADIIIAHNGNSFDQKWAYAQFLVYGIRPPEPAKYIDTKIIAKNKFKFNSNSLNNLAKYLDLGEKVETGGIDLWVDCIEKNDKKAWLLMEKYNKQDVVLLEQVYLRMLPYITNHPNLALMNGERHACPNCSSKMVTREGTRTTKSGTYIRWKCQECFSWHQSPVGEDKQIR